MVEIPTWTFESAVVSFLEIALRTFFIQLIPKQNNK